MPSPRTSGSSEGPAVDRAGVPVIDPTENVKAILEAAVKRIDDLRDAETRYNDLRAAHSRDMAQLRQTHAKELSEKESSRLDSIRQVDREDVAKTAAANNLAIGTLAKQTVDLASTLQIQVQATATAAETRRNADMTEVNKRVSALELAGSASAGKQQVADPMLDALVRKMDSLIATRAEGAGSRRGLSTLGAVILGVVSVIGGLIGIASLIFTIMRYAGGQ